MRTAAIWAAALFTLATCVQAPAQTPKKYAGPRPDKADVPFLLHATKLIELEQKTATEARTKEGTLYTVAGAESPVKTPVPEPIFLFRADRINPDRLTLFRMTVRGANRTLMIPEGGRRRKEGPKPVFMLVTMLEPGLYRIEVNEPLEDGEYCLLPEGSNDMFCFSEY